MQITATSSVQAVQPVETAAKDTTPAGQGSAPAAPSVPVRLLNPQPVIDPALGIVVTEYFNRAGDLTSQYPTEKALDSYRIHGVDNGSGASAPASGAKGVNVAG